MLQWNACPWMAVKIRKCSCTSMPEWSLCYAKAKNRCLWVLQHGSRCGDVDLTNHHALFHDNTSLHKPATFLGHSRYPLTMPGSLSLRERSLSGTLEQMQRTVRDPSDTANFACKALRSPCRAINRRCCYEPSTFSLATRAQARTTLKSSRHSQAPCNVIQ